MTERQEQILEVVKDYIKQIGYPPTLREIAEMVELKAPSVVFYHLQKLRDEGYIELDGVARGIRVVKRG